METNLQIIKNKTYKLIGRQLHILRITKGAKQVTVAADLKIPQSMLSEIEQGKRRSLTLDIIIELSHYYGEQWCDLLQRCMTDDTKK